MNKIDFYSNSNFRKNLNSKKKVIFVIMSKKLSGLQNWKLSERIYSIKSYGNRIIGATRASDNKEVEDIAREIFRIISDSIYTVETFEQADNFENILKSYENILKNKYNINCSDNFDDYLNNYDDDF